MKPFLADRTEEKNSVTKGIFHLDPSFALLLESFIFCLQIFKFLLLYIYFFV